jgi:C4-dicarboxylate-specific signal transduction histidine kinase
MTARAERYYQWVLILSLLLLCLGFGSLATIGFLRSAKASEALALAQTEGRITDLIVAAGLFVPSDPAAATRIESAVGDLVTAVEGLRETAGVNPGALAGLDVSATELEALGLQLAATSDQQTIDTLLAKMHADSEEMVSQAKSWRVDLTASLDRLSAVFMITLLIAGLSLAGVIYLMALLFSAIRSNLRWNTAVLSALDRGDVAVPRSSLRLNRFFPGAGQMARQTADLSSRMAGLVEEQTLQAQANQRMSEELRQNVEEMERSREEFARSAQLAAIGKLAGSVSHEINNPVTGVMGYVAYARRHVDDPTVLMYLEKAAREIERIGRIAKSLLVFSRHNPRNEPLPFGVSLAIDNVVMLAKPQLDDAGVRIVREGVGQEHSVLGHIDAFQQALLNLLLNARYALLQSDVRVITVRVVGGDLTTAVEVMDTGPGVAPEFRASLFEPFATTKPAGEGSGLGLAVTREVMLRMGGTSEFDPTFGPGAKFVLTLPVAPREDTPPTPVPEPVFAD